MAQRVKYWSGVLLLGFAGASLLLAVIRDARSPGAGADEERLRRVFGPEAPEHQYAVIYLHGEERCRACLNLEAFTKAAVEEHFAAELRSGQLAHLVLSRHLPGERPYAELLRTGVNAVVLAELRRGRPVRCKRLDELWRFSEDQPAFAELLRSEVRAFLEKP